MLRVQYRKVQTAEKTTGFQSQPRALVTLKNYDIARKLVHDQDILKCLGVEYTKIIVIFMYDFTIMKCSIV